MILYSDIVCDLESSTSLANGRCGGLQLVLDERQARWITAEVEMGTSEHERPLMHKDTTQL